jgi:hypothetical protein
LLRLAATLQIHCGETPQPRGGVQKIASNLSESRDPELSAPASIVFKVRDHPATTSNPNGIVFWGQSAHRNKVSSSWTLFSGFRSRFTLHAKRLTEPGCPIRNRMAIHPNPNVVRLRNNAASIALRPSPFRSCASSAIPVPSEMAIGLG